MESDKCHSISCVGDVVIDFILCVTYTGLLHSLDDYYQLSSEMVMLQTTNNVLNPTLFSLITPQSLLSWQRVRTACMMARSGREWYEQVRRYNSGTVIMTVILLFTQPYYSANVPSQML